MKQTALSNLPRRVLRPIVRLLMNSGVTYPQLADLLRELFVEVAESDFAIGNERPSDSRINLLTGVHRREISRLRGRASATPSTDSPAPSFGAQLVAKWVGSPRYTDNKGAPLVLKRHASESDGVSFESLVAEERTDIRPRVVLDELVRLGIARINDQECVELLQHAYVPEHGSAEMLEHLVRNVGDHTAVAVNNVLGIGPARLERSVYYDGMSKEVVERLHADALVLGMDLLTALNQTAIESEKTASPADGEQHRFTCGVYFFTEPTVGSKK